MKDSQKETLVRILRDMIRQNRIGKDDHLSRHRLKGALHERAQTVAEAQNLLATIRMSGRSRDWNPVTKDIVADLRKIASDYKLTASERMVACKRLAYLAGFLPQPSDEPLDRLLRTFVESKPKPVASNVTTFNFDEVARTARTGGV